MAGWVGGLILLLENQQELFSLLKVWLQMQGSHSKAAEFEENAGFHEVI